MFPLISVRTLYTNINAIFGLHSGFAKFQISYETFTTFLWVLPNIRKRPNEEEEKKKKSYASNHVKMFNNKK